MFFSNNMLSQNYTLTRTAFPTGAIIVFDDTCNLCNKAVNFILDHDTKNFFYFADKDGTAAIKLRAAADLAQDTSEKTILLFKDNAYYSQSRAVLEIMRGLGFPYSLFYLMIIIPFPLRDLFYGIIRKNRYAVFGQSNTCRVMTDDIHSRFL